MACACQARVFLDAPPGVTKIILATNVAEASVTINHVALVVDCGRVKRMAYDGARAVSSLQARRAPCTPPPSPPPPSSDLPRPPDPSPRAKLPPSDLPASSGT